MGLRKAGPIEIVDLLAVVTKRKFYKVNIYMKHSILTFSLFENFMEKFSLFLGPRLTNYLERHWLVFLEMVTEFLSCFTTASLTSRVTQMFKEKLTT